MMINEKKADRNVSKEVKVRIPVEQHVKLHTIKVIEGTQISEIVERALTLYFEARREETA